MDLRLKALKSLQQLICLAAAAVLAFALTPDRSQEYLAALRELEHFQKVSLRDYPAYVKQQLAGQEDANRAILLKAVERAHLSFRRPLVFSEPIIMDAPPQGAYLRLRDFEEFVTARHTVGVWLLDDEQEVGSQLAKQLKEKVHQPVTLTGIYASSGSGMTIDNVPIADPVVLHNTPNSESLQFLLYSGLPMPPSIYFSVGCVFKPSTNSHLALDWLRSDENGKYLVTNSGLVFPKLRPFWARIADMGADNATLFLQERIEATTRGTLNFFGVSVDRDLILFAGPAALFGLMLFFLLHLRQVNEATSWEAHEVESARDYPWIACFQGRLSGIATYGCLIVLPIGSSLLLLLEHGGLEDPSTWLGAGLTLLVTAVAIFTIRAIHGFREHLRDGESSLPNVPNDQTRTAAKV